MCVCYRPYRHDKASSYLSVNITVNKLLCVQMKCTITDTRRGHLSCVTYKLFDPSSKEQVVLYSIPKNMITMLFYYSFECSKHLERVWMSINDYFTFHYCRQADILNSVYLLFAFRLPPY